MKQVPDRKRLRREYLRRRTTAELSVGTYWLLFVAVLLMSIGAGFIGFFMLLWYLGGIEVSVHYYGFSVFRGLFWAAIGVIVYMVSVSVLVRVTRSLWQVIQCAQQNRRDLTYFPSVTASTLPAAEILVRAADEPPVAQGEVLLRAAQGQETPKEELLRVNQGE